MIIELKRQNQLITQHDIIDCLPVYEKSILVHEFIVRVNLYESESIAISFAENNNALTHAIPLLLRYYNDNGTTKAEYFTLIPNVVTQTAGEKTASIMILDDYSSSTKKRVITTADILFNVQQNNINVGFEPVDVDEAELLQEQINKHEERITKNEEKIENINENIAHDLIDLQYDESNGETTKKYRDGTTVTFEISGGETSKVKISNENEEILQINGYTLREIDVQNDDGIAINFKNTFTIPGEPSLFTTNRSAGTLRLYEIKYENDKLTISQSSRIQDLNFKYPPSIAFINFENNLYCYSNGVTYILNGTVFEKSEKVVWECSNCGHTFEGEAALELCPVCKHPKAYFFMKAKNY